MLNKALSSCFNWANKPRSDLCIHQDIKPDNILIKSKMQASNAYDSCFGLADFGTSSYKKAEAKQGSVDNYGTRTYGTRYSSCISNSWLMKTLNRPARMP